MWRKGVFSSISSCMSSHVPLERCESSSVCALYMQVPHSQTMNLPGWVFAARHLNGELKSVGEQVVEVLHPTLNFVPAKNLMSRLNDQISRRPGID